jgi:hypothetical protein
MRKLTLIPMDATAHAVYLTGAAINSLIQALPGQARNNFYEINKINCLQDKHDVTL